MKLRLPQSYYNPVSYTGTVIALIALFMFVFLYVLASLSSVDRAYVGIVLFIVIPAFIILGLLLIPLGMWLFIRQRRRQGKSLDKGFPVLDLNQPGQRTGTIIFALGTTLFLFLSALGSYEAYHFTESVPFCGQLCHQVMEPEHTAYQNSPHARVTCVECHVGAGANWYVKSKLSGLYQVYATLANVYPRPIPVPVANLRPARETCESCHWPQKIYGKQQRREIYFLPDESNTRWEIEMLMNTGSGNAALGQSSGIHWHINPDVRIEYFAADAKRLEIPRVVLTNAKSGEKVVYDGPAAGAETAALPLRQMDCIDCHNRPSHGYRDPNRFINTAMAAGEIDPALPGIKRAAVEACMTAYGTPDSAQAGIAAHLRTFGATLAGVQGPEAGALLERAIAGTRKAYSCNIFPRMKVTWNDYPDHIGHLNSPGCFRCHDGQHTSAQGRTISNSCTLCHDILAQGKSGALAYSNAGSSLEFVHPEDIGDSWKEAPCSECHAQPPI
ncbi:MAG TPA: NapC/NirT family cytochrome c [bacterium]|nr:NapC/NirT family cytochrome c [bacterium]